MRPSTKAMRLSLARAGSPTIARIRAVNREVAAGGRIEKAHPTPSNGARDQPFDKGVARGNAAGGDDFPAGGKRSEKLWKKKALTSAPPAIRLRAGNCCQTAASRQR